MKKLFRSRPAQWILSWLVTGYMALALHTVRWKHHNLECVEPTLAGDGPAIALFWHGRLPLCLATAPQWWRKRTKALISPSADGEYIAEAMRRSGFPAIRGSSAKPGDSAKSRAVVAAFREAVTWLRDGGALVITPDGPRGPAERIAPGSIQMARRSGAPVFLMGIAAAPNLTAEGTWDKASFALPFARGAVVWDGPFTAPPDADAAAVDALVETWSARLSALTRQAEALVA